MPVLLRELGEVGLHRDLGERVLLYRICHFITVHRGKSD